MKPIVLGVIGVEHLHIYGQLKNMLDLGCTCKGWWSEGDPYPVSGFKQRFPDIPRVANRRELLNDPTIDLILLADIPVRRAAQAIEAMQSGKDIMTDKPGCTSLDQLAKIKNCVNETQRIWSINFSERFEAPSVTKAIELIAAGAIGNVIQTIGLGPHRLNINTRPEWFFEESSYGGILTDIASHQIDQFLILTGSTDAQIVASSVGNLNNAEYPGLQDFGEILLRSDRAQGYIRVDWHSPAGLPTWGDGRLTVLGSEGYLELRKYVDIAGRAGKDHVFLVNGDGCEYIDASASPLPYFSNLISDVRNRTQLAMDQSQCFKTMELALQAQSQATRL